MRTPLMTFAAPIALALVAVGCQSNSAPDPRQPTTGGQQGAIAGTDYSYSGWVQGFFQANCVTGCHDSNTKAGGIELDTFATAQANAQAALTSLTGNMPVSAPGSLAAKATLLQQWINNNYPQTMSTIGGGSNLPPYTGTQTQASTSTGQSYSYQGWVAGFLTSSGCTGCHSSSAPQGGITLDTYQTAMANAQAILSSIGASGDMPSGNAGSIARSNPNALTLFQQWISANYPQTDAQLPAGATSAYPGTTTGGNVPGYPSYQPTVTYQAQVQQILQNDCVRCHGQNSGNGDLTTLQTSQALSDRIGQMVDAGTMPQGGTMPASDKQTILQWVNSGAN